MEGLNEIFRNIEDELQKDTIRKSKGYLNPVDVLNEIERRVNERNRDVIVKIIDEMREEGRASVEGFNDDMLQFSLNDIKKMFVEKFV